MSAGPYILLYVFNARTLHNPEPLYSEDRPKFWDFERKLLIESSLIGLSFVFTWLQHVQAANVLTFARFGDNKHIKGFQHIFLKEIEY